MNYKISDAIIHFHVEQQYYISLRRLITLNSQFFIIAVYATLSCTIHHGLFTLVT